MVTMKNLDKFIDIISSKNRIIGAKFCRQYFENHNIADLWNEFETAINHLSHLKSNLEKLEFLKMNWLNVDGIPNCYCGKKIRFLNGKISEYCSKSCALSSPKRCKRISETKKNADNVKINSKREETMLQKYGVKFNSQREDIHDIWMKPKLSSLIFDKLNDMNWLNIEYNVNKRSAVDIANELNAYYGTVLWYCRKFGFNIRKQSNYSIYEMELFDFLKSLNVVVVHSDWSILKTKELDIFLPDNNLAIEIDGLYYHSLSNADEIIKENKQRHLFKTVKCKEQHIQLMHFTDYEWKFKNSIVKSMIMSKLNLTKKIHARKCILGKVDAKNAKIFMEENHINGHSSAKIYKGLYFNNELVMLMTFSKPRFSKETTWELVRMATKLNYTVIGGIAKILKAFRDENDGSILSYCDRRFGEGMSYFKVGFKYIRSTDVGYFWTDGNIPIKRFKTQKLNLEKWLPSFDTSKSESENMFNSKYKRFWDCGNNVYILK